MRIRGSICIIRILKPRSGPEYSGFIEYEFSTFSEPRSGGTVSPLRGSYGFSALSAINPEYSGPLRG